MAEVEDAIYRQALESPDAQKVLDVAHVFDTMGWYPHAKALKERAEYLTFQRAWPVRSAILFGVDHHIYKRAMSPAIEVRGFSLLDLRKDTPQVAFGVDIAALQARLNALGASPPLVVDGVSGPKTINAIKAFQASHNIETDGVVGPITLAALGMTGNEPAPSTTPLGKSGIIAVRGLEKTSNAFRNKLVQVSNALNVSPDWLASVISFETGGTFSPSAQNRYTKATGLIQFMPSTAKSPQLNTTIDALKNMTDVAQLDYVYKYLAPFKGRMRSLNDTYLAVFMPTQMGKGSDSVVASQGSAVYNQNPGFDRDQKGYFTVGDITSAIHAVYNAGVSKGRIPVETIVAVGGGVGALASIGLGAWYLWKRRKAKQS
jgi:peptidoglycan hydrolase-like protein with peptidoglycan-binding domain